MKNMTMYNDQIVHYMTIKPEYFESVKNGDKIYEVRTNDSRRQKMQVGEYIQIFREPELEEFVLVEIKNKILFKNFTELYDSMPKKQVGFEGKNTEDIVGSLRRFYTVEQEELNGVVAIEIKVVNLTKDYTHTIHQ